LRLRLDVVVAALVVLGGLGFWLLAPDRQATASAAGCEPVHVIAARGSGEPIEADPGKTLWPFIRQLQALADPGVVVGEGLPYPAVSIGKPEGAGYQKSVRTGVDNLVQLVKGRAGACPDEKLVLAGYSQGAQVVSTALGRLTPVASHVGAVVLFGDPHFDPHSRAAQGTFSPKRHGILGLPDHDFPAAFPHVLSYCKGGDVFCQGLPNTTTAHKHYAPRFTQQAAEKVADWLGLRRSRTCTPATNIAAILDDSGSMGENDPLNIRAAAMQLLITEPSAVDRTLGAVEFGDEAGPLFAPASIATGKSGMVAALGDLRDDGYAETGTDTNYNAAFAASAASQPGADARIFLTDGEHNVGSYEDGHQGGPRTYVIGLNIGPSGEGDPAADLLGRIASETSGVYYPLRLSSADDAEVQMRRLQPVFNEINAKLECAISPSQAIRKVASVGAPAKPVAGSFLGNVGEQIVISWTTPGAQIGIAGVTVRNPGGAIVANLTGKRPKRGRGRRSRHPIAALQTNTVSGGTFRTVTVARPKHGAKISVRIVAEELPAPTVVTVQLAPVEALPAAAPETVTVPAPTSGATAPTPTSPAPSPPSEGGSPPPPANHLEQETPNHPVNTFTNYHNASGMGPQIAAGQWVEVSCRVYDPTIASVNPDGYWYRIASAPWNNAYYAPANTFMNGDPYGGPYTHNTDFSVPLC
jgi:cutinase